MELIATLIALGLIWACCGGLKKVTIFDKPYKSYEEMVSDCSKDLKKNAPGIYDLKMKQAREWDQQNKKG